MSSIPHVIHRIWIGAPMPPEYAAFEEEWLRLNPGWEVRHWGEDELEQLDLGPVADLYRTAGDWCPERYIPRFRSNLARYAILHAHGGVYVDCDMKPFQALPDLDGIDGFAGVEGAGWLGNAILGSIPGHPLWARLLDGAEDSCRQNPGARSPVTTGPRYMTNQNRAAPAGERLHEFPREIFYPRHWRTPDEPIPDIAVTDHLWTALRGQVSVIIPYRPDGGRRDAALAWVLEQLVTEHPDWQVVVEEDDGDGPFNRAQLIRAGVARSMGDVLVIHDADVWVPGLPDAIQAVRDGRLWAQPHRHVLRLSVAASDAVLAGTTPEIGMELDEPAYRGCLTGGCAVISRAQFWDTPPDPAFEGWGGEDVSWGAVLSTLAGTPWQGSSPLFHFWHEPQPRLSRAHGSEANRNLEHWYRSVNGRPTEMRVLVDYTEGRLGDMASDITITGLWIDKETGGLVTTCPARGRKIASPGGKVPREWLAAFEAITATRTDAEPEPEPEPEAKPKKAKAKKKAAKKATAKRKASSEKATAP